jgi:hypothetical protein
MAFSLVKSRKGHRSIRAAKLLDHVRNLTRVEKKGTMLKMSAMGDSEPLWHDQDVGKVDYESKLPTKLNPRVGAPDKRQGDVPSDNVSGIGVRTEDGRSSAMTVSAGGTQATGDIVPDAMPQNYKLGAVVDELLKMGAMSDEEASHTLERLDSMDKNKLTPGQVGRYAAIGAVAGPVIGMSKSLIQGRGVGGHFGQDFTTAGRRLRHVAGDAAAGAMTSGAIPLVRSALDRSSALNSLKDYVETQQPAEMPKSSSAIGAIEHEGAGMAAKIPGIGGALKFLHKHENPIEVAGLGYLAAPSVDNMQAKYRARRAGDVGPDGHVSEEAMNQRRLIPEKYHDPIEATGLASLAVPLVAKRLHSGSWH